MAPRHGYDIKIKPKANLVRYEADLVNGILNTANHTESSVGRTLTPRTFSARSTCRKLS